MLAAQADIEELVIVTIDRNIRRFGIEVLW